MQTLMEKFRRVHPALGFVTVGAVSWSVTPHILTFMEPMSIIEPAAKPSDQPATSDDAKVAWQSSSPGVIAVMRSSIAAAVPSFSVADFISNQAGRLQKAASAATAAAGAAVQAKVKSQVAALTHAGIHYYEMNKQAAEKSYREQTARSEAAARFASNNQPHSMGRSVAIAGDGRASQHTFSMPQRGTIDGGYGGSGRGNFVGNGNGYRGGNFPRYAVTPHYSFNPGRGSMGGGGRHR